MTVTVRKKRSWRYLMRFLTALDVMAAAALCALYARMLTIGVGAMLFGMVTVPMAAMLLYYERWSVTFSREGIRWKGMFRPWSQVERVRESWSATEQRVLSIRFRDGKTLRFRMEEENAEQARKMICRHCSIET